MIDTSVLFGTRRPHLIFH